MNLVKSEELLADGMSRWTADHVDYRLDRVVFMKLFEIPARNDLPSRYVCLPRQPSVRAVRVQTATPSGSALEVDLSPDRFKSCWANPLGLK